MIDTAKSTTTANIQVSTSGWASPSDVAVSPDGSRAYATNPDNSSVSVIDTTTNTVTATVAAPGTVLTVSSDGKKVYVTGQGTGSATVIDTATNTVSARISVSGHQGIAVTPNGSRLYIGQYTERAVRVIDTATNQVIAIVSTSGGCQGLAAHPDGTRVYVADNGGQRVSVINTATNTITASITMTSPPNSVAVSPDGTGVYVTLDGGPVSLIDTASNKVVATIPIWDAGALAVSPDGTFVYVPDYSKHMVSVIDVASRAVTGSFAVDTLPGSVAFGPGVPLSTTTPTLVKGAPLKVRYSTVPGNVTSKNWVGIYPDDGGATVGKKNSFTWAYAPNAAGTVTLDTGSVPGPGRYAAWYLYNDGYTPMAASPLTFTVT